MRTFLILRYPAGARILALVAASAAFCACSSRTARAANMGSLNDLLESIRQKHKLPALAGAIVTSRGLTSVGAVGLRKLGAGAHVTVDDQFHLGSDTKAMTATLLAMLVERGKLAWTTTLAEALPTLASSMNPAYRSVTIEQLLAHRSGMTSESWIAGMNGLQMHELPGSPMEQRNAYVAAILKEAPEAPPGSKFIYSNRNYAIAGNIAERIEGKPWEELMQEELFRPLGMKSAGFGAMGTTERLEEPWQHAIVNGVVTPVPPGPMSDNPPAIGPAGTVHCSIGDWAKFIRAHLAGERGEPGILRPETFRKLHTAPYGDYGFGWGVTSRPWAGGKVLTHAGSNTMNYCVVWMAPKKDFAVLVMTNEGGDDAAAACDEAASALIQAHAAE